MMKSWIVVGWMLDCSGPILKHRNEKLREIAGLRTPKIQEDRTDDVDSQTLLFQIAH